MVRLLLTQTVYTVCSASLEAIMSPQEQRTTLSILAFYGVLLPVITYPVCYILFQLEVLVVP